MHAATIEHRKNNHNNHKSVRIKETKVATEKRSVQFMHQFYFICSPLSRNRTLIIHPQTYYTCRKRTHKHMCKYMSNTVNIR